MNKNFEEAIIAKTSEQYDEMQVYIAEYTNTKPRITGGRLVYISGTERITFVAAEKKVILKSTNQKKINEMKRHLEYIVRD